MRERLYLSLLMAVLLCLVGWTAHAQLSRGTSTRPVWEYTYNNCRADQLNAAGAQGWELVAATSSSADFCYMKRAK
jgi:hypothetical protein